MFLIMKNILCHKFEDIISVDNLLEAWQEFLRGKRNKSDVQEFQLHLMDNILSLHYDLNNNTYKHGGYQQFKINDPKPRTIHKASVRDRLLYCAVYRIIYPFFDNKFIANVYMNEFDQFVKHKLRIKYYIRYADDFIFLSIDKNQLKSIIPIVDNFLQNELKLTLHPDKVFIKTLFSGVDFLGWINFADHKVLRTKTKRRMIKSIKENLKLETINSYLGLLKHGNSCKIRKSVIKSICNNNL